LGPALNRRHTHSISSRQRSRPKSPLQRRGPLAAHLARLAGGALSPTSITVPEEQNNCPPQQKLKTVSHVCSSRQTQVILYSVRPTRLQPQRRGQGHSVGFCGVVQQEAGGVGGAPSSHEVDSFSSTVHTVFNFVSVRTVLKCSTVLSITGGLRLCWKEPSPLDPSGTLQDRPVHVYHAT
jgi:hypothetical protein